MTPQEWARDTAKTITDQAIRIRLDTNQLSKVIEQALLEARDQALEEAAERVALDVGPSDGRFDTNQRIAFEIRSLTSKGQSK
jgi:hypothetical protein